MACVPRVKLNPFACLNRGARLRYPMDPRTHYTLHWLGDHSISYHPLMMLAGAPGRAVAKQPIPPIGTRDAARARTAMVEKEAEKEAENEAGEPTVIGEKRVHADNIPYACKERRVASPAPMPYDTRIDLDKIIYGGAPTLSPLLPFMPCGHTDMTTNTDASAEASADLKSASVEWPHSAAINQRVDDLCDAFRLREETAQHARRYINQYFAALATDGVPHRDNDLPSVSALSVLDLDAARRVAAVCVLIASKFIDIKYPGLEGLCCFGTKKPAKKELKTLQHDFEVLEMRILERIHWKLWAPQLA